MREILPSATMTSNAQESGQSIVQVVRIVLVTTLFYSDFPQCPHVNSRPAGYEFSRTNRRLTASDCSLVGLVSETEGQPRGKVVNIIRRSRPRLDVAAVEAAELIHKFQVVMVNGMNLIRSSQSARTDESRR